MGAAALYLLVASPAGAFDLFATHEVTAQFATPDGKPMANAEVRAFAPGDPNSPAMTGRTDAEGKFRFAADRDGFWSAEAHSADYVARVMIRVGGEQQSQNWLSPVLVIGFLVVMLGPRDLVPTAARASAWTALVTACPGNPVLHP